LQQLKPRVCGAKLSQWQREVFAIADSSHAANSAKPCFSTAASGIQLQLALLQTIESNLMAAPIRVLLAKVGLDGHDRGVKVVARALRDAGMDVIYTGLHRTPDEVVVAAIQEDADILGVSLLSGTQMTVFPKIFARLKEEGADDMIVVAGGVMPDEDAAALKQMGVSEVLLQDTPLDRIVARLRELVSQRGAR
jgi:methylmalonyl-CoA mutase cobalamin-binding domain/chain